MKSNVHLLKLLVAALCACAYPALAQNVQTTDPRISTETGDRLCVANQIPTGAGQTALGNGTVATLGDKIMECDNRLGTNKGVIEVFGGGDLTWQAGGGVRILLSPNRRLILHAGTYTSASPFGVIFFQDNTTIEGDGFSTVLHDSPTTFDGSNNPFTVLGDYLTNVSNINGVVSNVRVRSLQIQGAQTNFNSIKQTISLGNCQDCSVDHVFLNGTHAIGIQAGAGSGTGNRAQNVDIHDNILLGVASQNIAVTNGQNVKVHHNTVKAPGQAGGPGVTPIDIEPNASTDYELNVEVTDNTVDAQGGNTNCGGSICTLNGIAVQNGSGVPAAQYRVTVARNFVSAADTSSTATYALGAGLFISNAPNTVASDNHVQRFQNGAHVYGQTTNLFLVRNRFVSTGYSASDSLTFEGTNNTGTVAGNICYSDSSSPLTTGEDCLFRNVTSSGSSVTFDSNILYQTGGGSGIVRASGDSYTINYEAGVLGGLIPEGALSLSDVATNDVSTSRHGFAPKAPNDTTKFLRGDGTWAVPSASSSSGWTDDGTAVRLTTSTDNVGIGTSAPTTRLTVTDGATPYAAGTTDLMQLKRNTTNGTANGGTSILFANVSNGFRIKYGGTTDRLSFIDGGNVEVLSLVNGGNVGVGTASPTAKLQVTSGDIYVTTIGNGLILKSPNGSCFRITVSDAGALSASSVTCP